MVLVITRSSQAAARYTPVGGAERCSQCRFFNPQGTCGRIIGPVSPRGWCKYYARELAQAYNAGGSAAAAAAAAAASLDLSFMTPGSLDPRITFTRTTVGTYFDAAGALQTAAIGTPRWDYDPVTHALRGLLIEEARSNLLLNSATLGTQSVAVTAQAYSLSFYGTGTITLSGASTAGPLVGTGAFPQRVALTFTPTAGTLTCTVSGSVLNAQLEAGGISTSYITTTGTTVSRQAETAFMVGNVPSINQTANSLQSEIMVPYATLIAGAAYASVELDDGTLNSAYNLRQVSPGSVGAYSFLSGALQGSAIAGTFSANTVLKHAAAYDGVALTGATALNGGAVVPFSFTAAQTGLSRLSIGYGRGSQINGWVRRVRYWPRVLSNAELQGATT